MNYNPLVTVIVPAYNHEKYVIECLEGIYNQTFKDYQWIVVDDFSSDTTSDVLKANQNKYGYELILHTSNWGISKTLTDTISNFAKGKYISICASDDVWLSNKLELQVSFMEKHPNFGMCYGLAEVVDCHSVVINHLNKDIYKGGYIFKEILSQEFHPPVSYMIRTKVLKEVGYFKDGIIAEDFYMNCKISYKYPIGYIPEVVFLYRYAPLASKRDPYALLKSHEETINFYKKCDEYPYAYSKHCERCFLILSSYKRYKYISIVYLFKSFKTISIINVLRGIYRFCFFRK